MTEWNATSYHKVSAPQTFWGQKVLNRLHVAGDERAIDAGCGSGRLTGELMERLPKGRLVAIDRSWNMLMTARANLRPELGSRVSFVQVSLPDLPFAGWADLVFSTATFHWVKDHPALFAGIFTTLRSGGKLHAQCGGGPNLARAHVLAEEVMHSPEFARYFIDWPGPWEFAYAEVTAERLKTARVAVAMSRLNREDPALDEINFGDWLRERGESAAAVDALWNLLALPTLNLHANDASLALAATVFQIGLLESNDGGDVGYARVPLSRLHSDPAVRAL